MGWPLAFISMKSWNACPFMTVLRSRVTLFHTLAALGRGNLLRATLVVPLPKARLICCAVVAGLAPR